MFSCFPSKCIKKSTKDQNHSIDEDNESNKADDNEEMTKPISFLSIVPNNGVTSLKSSPIHSSTIQKSKDKKSLDKGELISVKKSPFDLNKIRKNLFNFNPNLNYIKNVEQNIKEKKQFNEYPNAIKINPKEQSDNNKKVISTIFESNMILLAEKIANKKEQQRTCNELKKEINNSYEQKEKINSETKKYRTVIDLQQKLIKDVAKENQEILMQISKLKQENQIKNEEMNEELLGLNMKFDNLQKKCKDVQTKLSITRNDLELERSKLQKSRARIENSLIDEITLINSHKHLIFKKEYYSNEENNSVKEFSRIMDTMTKQEQVPDYSQKLSVHLKKIIDSPFKKDLSN